MSDGYKIGYGKPPPQHQFKKGASGNPKGRPRKVQSQAAQTSGHAELDDILLKEALRPITIRENDEILEIPMIQAVLRSLGVAAVKGHHRSQIVLANMVKSVQAARFEDRKELFKSAIEYRDSWWNAFKEADRRGEPRPDPVPHPDDIVLDTNKMEVRFNGPASPDEKAHWDMMLKRKADALEEIAYYREKLKRPSKYKSMYEEDMRWEQKFVELIDAFIPSEQVRRRPGFDLTEWRESNPRFQEVIAKHTPRSRGKRTRTPRRINT
jgi:hypothetical protein